MSNAFRGMRDQGEDDHDDLCVRGARNVNSNKSTDELLAMLHGQDVGSSGSLLFHPARGAEIDRADLVVRFNDAPVEGFERFVGNRTDVRLYNTYAIGKGRRGAVDEADPDRADPSTCSAFLGFPKDNACCPREYMILNSGFGTYARHAWMSGSLGMLALSKWCERGVTNLYGFTSPARARTLQAPGLAPVRQTVPHR
ncbi:hypothetical protein EMIHUDRAFT_214079 [Emiliania huxleyi CCMP1516]|uniref:beta-galactoside alpha-(2,6)-sialyltransferase n=2 Tax=Emiliania huxleyi TaxID=2903 RepID=A0A0D3IKK4_EMIH1|nr:hypothetical protein EMIHUDRAFT_214079 [Emiliania huxleyi CCMP1516]EOD11789.1 hypothetical protein EMIHUDRAFT_214079 [Emiliania huxleyi CCMP1516]|eukprot:XP_005764218.1 hypothetical protein EMIHUDRAFT_214079 [Emiliania huxleyi CCMP1516]